jgi:3-oxoacyl-[acyl-carrier protein] reductase
MDLGIAGRRALVCGGSRGMGYAIALQLAKEGAAVTIVARRPAPLAEAADAIALATGHTPTIVAADITTAPGRIAALSACPEPDILVTNSDGPHPTPLSELTTADWLAGLEALMLAPLALIQATLDPMIARRFGRIVNIVSRSVKIAQAEMPLSNGARSGLVGVVAGLSRQVARHNVTINNLLPGAFMTDRLRSNAESVASKTGLSIEEEIARRAASTPAQRIGDPAEFGDACVFLCAASSGFIVGQNLLLDGGAFNSMLG